MTLRQNRKLNVPVDVKFKRLNLMMCKLEGVGVDDRIVPIVGGEAANDLNQEDNQKKKVKDDELLIDSPDSVKDPRKEN